MTRAFAPSPHDGIAIPRVGHVGEAVGVPVADRAETEEAPVPQPVVAHLLSSQASYINGAIVPIDGGRAVLGTDPEARECDT